MNRRLFSSALVTFTIGMGLVPYAFAAGNSGGKKPKTPASASASASASAAPVVTASAAPTETASAPAPEASASAAPSASAPPPKPAPKEDLHDPTEIGGNRYPYIGLRYRGTILPQFLLNAFVTGGQTVYSNSIGIEADFHKDNFSFVPSLSYQDFNTGDMLFYSGSDTNVVGNYSQVNSSLKAIFANVDLLWSVPINKQLSFEYGVGLGIGATFGDLIVNWVKADNNGSLVDSAGRHYSPCAAGDTATGCNGIDHTNPTPVRTGGYQEKSWFDGGSKPSFLPNVSVPFNLRIHPIKEMEARVGLGISLYGFFFQLSADYGLPPWGPNIPKAEKSSSKPDPSASSASPDK